MNSNTTETWASKVSGKTLDRHGSHPEMSSSDTFLGRTSDDRDRHLANPMRHAGSHATELEYQVAGHDFGGSGPKMIEKEQLISANEDPINDFHQPLENHVHAKVRGPMADFSSMGANQSIPITVIDLDGETSGHLHHYGNHKPYHMHPIMLESGDMYFGLSRALFGTPQDGAMDRPSSRQARQENTGSPAADIGTFFQEPTTSTSGRPKSHHVEPFNAPAHQIHPVASHHTSHQDLHLHEHEHKHLDEEGYYMNHQPIHRQSPQHSASQGVYKHPTQHRAVHRHHNAAVGTPEMNLESVFREPKEIPIRSAPHDFCHKDCVDNDDYEIGYQHIIGHHSPYAGSLDLSHSSHEHDDHTEEGYYMNRQPIHGHSHHGSSLGAVYKHPTRHRAVHRHHNAPVGTPEMHLDDVFKEPAWYTTSAGSKGKKAKKHGVTHSRHVDPLNTPVHPVHPVPSHSHATSHHVDEEGYYMNHQPIQSQSLPTHHDWDLGPAYKVQQRKIDDSTVWNLGTLLDDTPSWAMNARPLPRKQQKKAEDSTTWNLGSLFDDTTPARATKVSNHAAKPSTSSSSSSSSHQQSRPLTVDQIARVAVPIGQTVTYTTVIRTTVTLMGVPSSLAHDIHHVQAERGHVLTDFSGPVSHEGQNSIWVRKESSEEMFEGDRVVCQNCRGSLSRL
ncbi:hypothetical protein CPB97_008810 [Podila verticillata]|nr:hypothetical protein CPB97_008810 [Podila verticillata]